MVPRGTPHVMRAGPGGGALLTLFTPAGLEKMFIELGRLPATSITDPKERPKSPSATIPFPSNKDSSRTSPPRRTSGSTP